MTILEDGNLSWIVNAVDSPMTPAPRTTKEAVRESGKLIARRDERFELVTVVVVYDAIRSSLSVQYRDRRWTENSCVYGGVGDKRPEDDVI